MTVRAGWLLGLVGILALALYLGVLPCGTKPPPPPVAAPAGPSHVLATFGGPGTQDGRFNRPRSVTQDGQGTCYVIDLTDRVQAFDIATGRFLRLWHLPDIRNGRPQRIRAGPDGTLYVTDTHYGQVLHYDNRGTLLGTFGTEGKAPGQLYYPVGICFLADGRIAVSEYGGHDRVQFFDKTGLLLGGFGRGGTATGEFMRPEAVLQGPDGNLYVADAANQRIQIFTSDGTFLRAFGEAGIARGSLSYPYDLAFDSRGRLIVLEYGAHRLSFWSLQGAWEGDLGGLGSRPGELASPWGLCALGDGTVLVTNSDNHRIERWRLP